MAIKSANVMARVEPEIKEQAETILSSLGIPVSVLINMVYRQIIVNRGLPFSLTLPSAPAGLDDLTREQFDTIMKTAYLTCVYGITDEKVQNQKAHQSGICQISA